MLVWNLGGCLWLNSNLPKTPHQIMYIFLKKNLMSFKEINELEIEKKKDRNNVWEKKKKKKI